MYVDATSLGKRLPISGFFPPNNAPQTMLPPGHGLPCLAPKGYKAGAAKPCGSIYQSNWISLSLSSLGHIVDLQQSLARLQG